MNLTLLSRGGSGPTPAPGPDLNERPPWRGSLWTVALEGMPYGPRPFAANNPLAMDYYEVFGAEDRAKMRQRFFAERGYVDCCPGPAFEPRSYNGDYPPCNFVSRELDGYMDPSRYPAILGTTDDLLDILSEIPPAQGRITYFMVPDKYPFQQSGGPNMDAIRRWLTPHYQHPRWKGIVRDWALAWEPDWSSAEFVEVSQWARETLGPEARIRIHLPPRHSAPGHSDEHEGECWRAVAPWVDGGLMQDSMDDGDRPAIEQFEYDCWDINRRSNGETYGGWPATGYAGRTMRHVMLEYASYWFYRGWISEADAKAYGEIVLRYTNLWGYGDGGPV